MKFCKRCSTEKEEILFSKGQIWCKTCHADYKKQWEEQHKDHVKARKHQYDIDNRDQQRKYIRQYRALNKNSVAVNRRRYVTIRRANDSVYRLNQQITSCINKAIKKSGSSKNRVSKSKYLPYTIEDLKTHIECQFEPWMNWNNQGVYNHKIWDDNDQTTWTWNIDHIIPRSDLPYASMEDDNFKKCWSLENLRPLASKLNVIEGSRKIRHRRK